MTANANANARADAKAAPRDRSRSRAGAPGKRAKPGARAPAVNAARGKKAPAPAKAPRSSFPRDLLVPLEQLVLDEANVRRVHRPEGLDELAALIEAQGLLQRLSVVARDDGRYGVVAGGRRLRAMQLLAAQGRWPATQRVECRLCEASRARQVSLAENSGREAMHPADQMVAFRQLIEDEHLSVAQVAARFGVGVSTVERRLRLARLSPRFLAMYREGEIDNDQLQALALIEDPAAQEAIWDGLRPHDRSAWRIREAATEQACGADSRLARFVGLDAYEAEGGAVRRDLFATGDDLSGIYLDNLPMLHTLAMDRLQGHVEAVRAEGWSWVEGTLDGERAAWRGFGCEAPQPRPPTAEEAAAIDELEAAQWACEQALDALREEGDPEDEGFDAREAQLDEALAAAEDRLATARATLLQWTPEQQGRAGALVRLDSRGAVVVERGLLRPEARADRPSDAVRAGAEGEAGGCATARPVLSERLLRDLNAHRTAALQAALLEAPGVALAALAHRMAETVFGLYGPGNDIVRVTTRVCGDGTLAQAASDYGDSRAAAALGQAQGQWDDRLPGRPEALFAWLLAQPQAVVIELLAYCTARSVDAIGARPQRRADLSDALAQALGLDMADWWQPTQRHYLRHVSKAAMTQAVCEATGVDAPPVLAGLKKDELAAHCAGLLEGTRWLPPALRAKQPEPAAPDEDERSERDEEDEEERGAHGTQPDGEGPDDEQDA